MSESIFSKISYHKASLVKFTGGLLQDPEKDEVSEIELVVNWDHNIKKLTEKELTIGAKCAVSFKPERFFNITLEYFVRYDCLQSVKLEEIEKEIGELLKPCADLNSLIVGELSYKLVGAPLIIPPNVSQYI